MGLYYSIFSNYEEDEFCDVFNNFTLDIHGGDKNIIIKPPVFYKDCMHIHHTENYGIEILNNNVVK